MRLHALTVLITGGGSDLGLALARDFLHVGSDVILCGPNADELDRALRRLPTLRACVCDISDPADRRALVDRLTVHCPRLNVIVHPALSTYQLNAAYHAASFQLTTALAPRLLRQREAAVINILPAPVFRPPGDGLDVFSRMLRREFADSAVKVFDVFGPIGDDGRTIVARASPAEMASTILRGMARNRTNIRIGQAQRLYLIASLVRRVAASFFRRRYRPPATSIPTLPVHADNHL